MEEGTRKEPEVLETEKGASSAHPMRRKAAHLPPKLGTSLRSADYQLPLLLMADDLNLSGQGELSQCWQ